GHVIDPEAAAPFGDIEIFAPELEAAGGAPGFLVGVDDLLDRAGFAAELRLGVEGLAARPVDEFAAVAVDVELVEIGIGVAVEIGAENRLRFGPFGDADGLDSLV